jgi:hypothetical protein
MKLSIRQKKKSNAGNGKRPTMKSQGDFEKK